MFQSLGGRRNDLMRLSFFCAGKKRERRLKQASDDADDVEDEEEDESHEADSSDPMMGFTFNECKSVFVSNGYSCVLWLYLLHANISTMLIEMV